MGFYFFPSRNRINGKYVNVFGERYDLKKINENEMKVGRINKKKVFSSEKEYAKYCDLRDFQEYKREKEKNEKDS